MNGQITSNITVQGCSNISGVIKVFVKDNSTWDDLEANPRNVSIVSSSACLGSGTPKVMTVSPCGDEVDSAVSYTSNSLVSVFKVSNRCNNGTNAIYFSPDNRLSTAVWVILGIVFAGVVISAPLALLYYSHKRKVRDKQLESYKEKSRGVMS